jgi:hypothetical protein
MKPLTLTAAFAIYGAQLVNPRWACSAIADDGSLVISGWSHLLKATSDGHKRYEDDLSTWTGNKLGRELLRNHLALTKRQVLAVRLVVATLKNRKDIEASLGDASPLRKYFSTDKDIVGNVISFDDIRFCIDFYST